MPYAGPVVKNDVRSGPPTESLRDPQDLWYEGPAGKDLHAVTRSENFVPGLCILSVNQPYKKLKTTNVLQTVTTYTVTTYTVTTYTVTTYTVTTYTVVNISPGLVAWAPE
jgi:hypothetical protein